MKFEELIEEITMKLDPSIMNKIITPELKILQRVFNETGFRIRIVGGAVRDILLGTTPKDVDLCTNATPDEMIQIFKKFNIPVIPSGIEHGTVTAVINKNPFEITTLRIDVEAINNRHAKVAYTRDWKEDAFRRDLTYNSMSLGFDGTLYDYTGGLKDLRSKTTRFVGDPDQRIKEDVLRILRFFRFADRFNSSNIDPTTLEALKNNASGLQNLSGERIWMEMKKIIGGQDPSKSLKLMCELNLAQNILLPCNSNIELLTRFRKAGANAIALLASILDINQARKIIDRWKLNNPEKYQLLWLVNNKNNPFDLEIAENMKVDDVDPNWILQLSIILNKSEIGKRIMNWKAPKFPISGEDLMKVGLKSGVELGNTLRALRKKWMESRFQLSKETLIQMVSP